ncbi:type IV fimbrial biogenesis protein FimT [Ectothiorhodospira magna]|uniref:Type II secretion system protein H n=1 Tax=Ectothiorhodospira magna TaxID=867345 RepID=A0A1H9DPD2_9GAMM|nr:GspH/FimT family pseudopilin [Ectothiorhodospira magna]SEQ15271.1 type IV fimbrial biogenesis protein FimT [Ectothiorhodospira magna]
MLRESGLTLIELLVTLAVAAVLFGIVAPGFAGMLREQQLITTTNTFISALNMARWEAIKRGHHVLVCPSTDGERCQAVSYGEGWLVGVVMDPSQGFAEPDDIIRRFGAVPPAVTIEVNGAMAQYIGYRNDGQTRRLNDALLMGSVRVCTEDGGRRIVISRTGRARVETDSC